MFLIKGFILISVAEKIVCGDCVTPLKKCLVIVDLFLIFSIVGFQGVTPNMVGIHSSCNPYRLKEHWSLRTT